MKTIRELETVEILGCKLDVYFSYDDKYNVFEIHAVEPETTPVDIQDLLSEFVNNRIVEELKEIYRKRGWM